MDITGLLGNWVTVWLALLVIFLVIELVTVSLATIWCAAGALVAPVLAFLGLPPGIQIAAFVFVSALLLFFTRPVAVKFFNKNRVKTNVESMIGKQGIVVTEIDNIANTGRVQVEGMEWLSKNYLEDGLIGPGEVVIVRAVEGVKLLVERNPYVKEVK